MIKKLSPLLLIIFSFFVTSAQSLKTYNGAFETRNLIGNAAYQYFENDQGGRTFDGSFKFSKTNNSVNIEGQFKNNLKSGLWKFKFTNYLSSDLMLKYVINSTSIGSYLDGKLNGKWNLQRTTTLSASNNTVSQYYKSELNSFSELFGGKKIDFSKKQTVLENATANFSNNHFVGDFIYSVNNGQTKVKGQFDDEGLMEGSWLVTYTKNGIPIEQKYMYLKGILFTIIKKDGSTGETHSDFDLEPRVKDFLKNLDVNNNTSFTRNHYYTLETLKPNRSGDLIDQALSIWIDNKSIENSAYNFEVKQGTIGIDNFPQKIMAENHERNVQKEKDDQERKEAEEISKQQNEISKQNQNNVEEYKSDEDKIFTRVENEAAFPGGEAAWRRFLEKNLNPSIPINNGAPQATYQVIVRFIVSKDGSVSDVQAETKHGYGMEDEAIKVIKNGPKWTPAILNGHEVNAYRRQPITFVVQEK